MPADVGDDLPAVSLADLIFLHTVAVQEFGGGSGIRDQRLLEAALARPRAGTVEGLFYASPHLRAAALLESLIRNHAFYDGNKRVAVMAAAYWLEQEGYEVTATNEELVEMAMEAATGKINHERIALWLERHSRRTQPGG